MPGPVRLKLRIPAIDLSLAGATLALIVIGLLTVYSATSVPGAHEGLWIKQLQWAALAILAAWIAAAVPYRVYEALAWPFYGVSLLLLVAVLVMGTTAMGRSEEHTSELQSLRHLVCRLLLEIKELYSRGSISSYVYRYVFGWI